MIKLHATVSKKVPIPGLNYSSRSYSAGIELEVADAASREQLEHRIREVYQLLERTVDAEIQAADAVEVRPPVNRLPDTNGRNGDPRGTRNGHLTTAQLKAIWGIGKSLGMGKQQILDLVATECGVGTVDELSVKQASSIIELLKARQVS